MKKIRLTSIQRDALLFKAIIRGVFPQPNKGELFFTPPFSYPKKEDDDCIYLSSEYYDSLFNSIKTAEQAGNFRNSNAESHWQEIIHIFQSATEANDVDYSNLQGWEL